MGAAAAAGLSAGAAPPKRAPNVLFLLSDDLRYDAIHAFGNPEVQTPNLDRLARRGTAFTQAYIMGANSAAVCAPSRAMLLTGRTLFHLPAGFTEPWTGPQAERGQCPYATFPEHFRASGYATFVTGKWHNGPPTLLRGFTGGASIFFGGMSDHRKMEVHRFDPSGGYGADTARVETAFSSTLFSNAAVEFLRAYSAEAPFLAYVSYTAPHDPRTPPESFARQYAAERITLPPNFLPEHPFDNGELRIRDEELAPWPRTGDEVRRHIADYYGMVTHLDSEIGRVLDALDASGQADNTIVVFTSDNGLALGQHGLLGKQSLYEHSVHVPLIVAGPGVPRGETRSAPCYLHDLFATLCELAGAGAPDSVEGSSLAPALRDSSAAVHTRLFHAYKDVQRAVREGDWKLIRYAVGASRRTQLFNLHDDPWETNDLSGSHEYAERHEALQRALDAEMAAHDDPARARFQ